MEWLVLLSSFVGALVGVLFLGLIKIWGLAILIKFSLRQFSVVLRGEQK